MDAELFGLENLMDKHPYDLSGGELQRLAACIAHLSSADIYLFDEPTKGMDGDSKGSLKELIFRLRDSGKCVVIASHDIEFCAETAGICCLLFDGSFISREKTEDFIIGNMYYTTPAAKMAFGIVPGAITSDDILGAFERKYEPREPVEEKHVSPPLHDNKREGSDKKGVGFLTLLFLAMIPIFRSRLKLFKGGASAFSVQLVSCRVFNARCGGGL